MVVAQLDDQTQDWGRPDICHLASAHERNDTRVGVKMAGSAMKAAFPSHLLWPMMAHAR